MIRVRFHPIAGTHGAQETEVMYMSAWVVTREHIALLVDALLYTDAAPDAPRDPNELGAILWQENVNSFTYRYSDPTPEEMPAGPFAFDNSTDSGAINKNGRPYVLKQIDCYRTQANEHPGWDTSDAERWTRALGEHLAATTEPTAANKSAYESAPWGV